MSIEPKLEGISTPELRHQIELADRKTYRNLDKFYRQTYVHPARFVGGQKLLENKPVLKCGTPERRSVADVNHFLKKLRRVFNLAVEQDWLAKNPFNRGSKLIMVSLEVERTRVLSHEEEQRLLDACVGKGKNLRPIITFAVETGLRRGELQKLQWFDVDLGRRQLRVNSENSKTMKSRLVPLSARAVEMLNEVRQMSRPGQNALVFNSGDFKRSFNTACRRAKIADLHFHDLRHTAITRWLEKGISPALAMKASGHSLMKAFLRYVNQSSNSVFDFALKLDQAA